PINGIIIVTSPQELVSMIVEKAVNMANMMNIPIIGVIENMSYVTCPDCNKKINIFGESHIEEVASKNNLKVLAKLPIDPETASLVDKGEIEKFKGDWLDNAAKAVLEQ
ncbi:MAG: P-loop NTPase, partial [Eubacterium sp.]